MADSDAVSVLRRMVAAFASGDAQDCDAYVSPNYLDHQGRRGLTLKGPDGFRQAVSAAHRTTAPEVLVQDVIADETRAVARVRWRFVSSEQGRSVERETIEIVRIEDGQAIEHWGAEAWSRTIPPEAD